MQAHNKDPPRIWVGSNQFQGDINQSRIAGWSRPKLLWTDVGLRSILVASANSGLNSSNFRFFSSDIRLTSAKIGLVSTKPWMMLTNIGLASATFGLVLTKTLLKSA